MTWDQLWPALTLVAGFALSQITERRRERHDRDRIVLQRAADVEGEALLELQERLPELQVGWLDLLDRWREHKLRQGEVEPEVAYEAAVEAARPWRRAKLLSSRIRDDTLRGEVEAAIELVYPFDHRQVSDMLTGRAFPYEHYAFDKAQQAIADTNEAIGRQLRQAAADAARRSR